MTKEEALQLFESSIDMIDLEGNFPDIDMVVTELEDGQQEIIVRLQGVDFDFHPASDISVIEAMVYDDLPDGAKNDIVLRKHKRKMIRTRKQRRDLALLKRVKALVLPAGVSLREFVKTLRHNLPGKEAEV